MKIQKKTDLSGWSLKITIKPERLDRLVCIVMSHSGKDSLTSVEYTSIQTPQSYRTRVCSSVPSTRPPCLSLFMSCLMKLGNLSMKPLHI